jgi:hypothetical protein
MKRLLLTAAAGILTVLGATMIAPAFAGDGALRREVQDVRAAVARYLSFVLAERDGYTVEGEPCVASPAGTMGIHAINPPLLANDAVDALRPEILLYVPKSNGELELVGVEYWKADADQDLATSDDKPSLLGRPFDGPMPGHNPTMPVHYDLHVWVAEASPTGLFAVFNSSTSISC